MLSELSPTVISRGPCDHCGSSDAFHEYDDGHTKCFSCGHFGKPIRDKLEAVQKPILDKEKLVTDKKPITPLPETFKPLSDRGISAKAAERYKIAFHEDGSFIHTYPYTRGGKHVANKRRTRGQKGFTFQGDCGSLDLFGQSAFPAGSARSITLVEGECDAAAAFDMNGGLTQVAMSRLWHGHLMS